jgi:hypothetical protein
MAVPDARFRMVVADAGLLVPLVWRSRKGLTGPRRSVAADWPGTLADAGIGCIVSCSALR